MKRMFSNGERTIKIDLRTEFISNIAASHGKRAMLFFFRKNEDNSIDITTVEE